jgi:Uma2 family endonuclease
VSLATRGVTLMATVTTENARDTDVQGDQCVVMHGIGWDGYAKVLRARGEQTNPRMVYLDGNLYLMSPAYEHEDLAEALGIFVHEVVTGLRIKHARMGSTTFRRKKKNGGVEGDKAYYLANAPRVRGKKKLNLRTDPPPDLVIEAVHTHDADAAVEVWRRFGVPEIWVEDGEGLTILSLQPDSQYVHVKSSIAFPFLSAAEIHDWVTRPRPDQDTTWSLDLRAWIAESLAPRVKSQSGHES